MRFLWAFSVIFATLWARRRDRPLIWWLFAILVIIPVAAMVFGLILLATAQLMGV